jgi:predicted DNA-binding protein with PD1-like motif
MRSKLLKEGAERTFAVILDTGDEAVACLSRFAREQKLGASRFTAIGAFSDVVLGFFDFAKRDYRRIPLNEQVEVLALIGDVALEGQEPKVHAHVVVGDAQGRAHGGHLLAAHVRPTLEVIITDSPAHLHKQHDPTTGLALIRV